MQNMFKVNNKDTRTISVAAYNVKFEHISHLLLVLLLQLLILSMYFFAEVSVWVCRRQLKKWEGLEGYYNHYRL